MRSMFANLTSPTHRLAGLNVCRAWRALEPVEPAAGGAEPVEPIQTEDGRPVRVASITNTGHSADTYNIKVARYHTFFNDS